MNKFDLTDEEINQLKAAAKILYKFNAENDAELNKITSKEDFPLNRYYNAIWTSMENEYFDMHLALKDLGKVIETLADSLQDDGEQECRDRVEEKITLKSLEGRHVLQGVELGKVPKKDTWFGEPDECNYVKFTLDGKHYMAIEDPSDGYRSYCEEVKVVEKPCRTFLPNIEVNVKYLDEKGDNFWNEDCDIIQIFDVKNNKMILEVGTENVGDWYPSCVFHYYPENMYCNEGR